MKHLSLLSSIAVLLFTFNTADAAPVTYTFTGIIDSGALNGETFSGQFSYDDAGLTSVGYEAFNLTTFTLNFLATTFALSDADSTTIATVDFSEGSFLGVNFLLDTLNAFQPNFALIPGLFDSSDAYFAYTSSTTGGDGFGSIDYQKSSVSIIPLPAALWLFIPTFLGTILISKRKTLTKMG